MNYCLFCEVNYLNFGRFVNNFVIYENAQVGGCIGAAVSYTFKRKIKPKVLRLMANQSQSQRYWHQNHRRYNNRDTCISRT